MIPPASREAIEDAMRRFDQELRASEEWRSWESNGAFKYALEAGGRRYPVKQIISMATGAPRHTFSGGPEANSYLTSCGFTVAPLREGEPDVIQRGLEKILLRYVEVRKTKPFGQDPDLWPAFNSVCDALRRVPSVASRPTINVVWSAGHGNWAHVPWISLLDSRETKTTQQGVYCVLLFREDMSGVYLTFNQGVTEPKKQLGLAQGLNQIKQRAIELRSSCGKLADTGYHLDGNIDLRAEGGLGSEYEASTIAYKLYEKGHVPSDEDIAEDLEAVLSAYEDYLSNKGSPQVKVRTSENSAPKPMTNDDGDAVERLRRSLEAAELHFSDELIANYLLALETKRFVILCGLSGTGKTQLAMAVADFFSPTVVSEVVDVPESAEVVETRPYMFQHDRMGLPSTIRAQLHLRPPDEGTKGGGQLEVIFPKGVETLAFWRDPDSTGNNLFFKGSFRDWFRQTQKPGSKLALKVVPGADGKPDSLEITVPKTQEEAVPLQNCSVIAVRPDWTDSRGLLGYFNPLTRRYVVEPALELLLRASDEVGAAEQEHRDPHPFFLVLDEMNLAHVEQYFSDFLSCLESGKPLDLHREPNIESGANEEQIAVPQKLLIPPNVYFTGTVNVDETTYMFSPKVLDRAFTIELQNVDLKGFGKSGPSSGSPDAIRLKTLPALGTWEKPGLNDWKAFEGLDDGGLRALLIELNDLLMPFGLHFGYRVANEVATFVESASRYTDGSAGTQWAALDLAILEKVLPKFHGTQEELDVPLRSVFTFAITGNRSKEQTWPEIRDGWELQGDRLLPKQSNNSPRLPRTAAKTWLMLHRLHRQGFTAFIS